MFYSMGSGLERSCHAGHGEQGVTGSCCWLLAARWSVMDGNIYDSVLI